MFKLKTLSAFFFVFLFSLISSGLVCSQALSGSSFQFIEVLENQLKIAKIDSLTQSKILSAANQIAVHETAASLEELRLRKPFFSKRDLVIWPSAETLSIAEPKILSQKLAQIAGELLFQPPTRFGIYSKSQNQFVRENLQAILARLKIEYFSLGAQARKEAPSRSAISRTLKIILRNLLPVRFSEVQDARLDEAMVKAFDLGGPEAVYKRIRLIYGPSLAFKYWMAHLANATQALSLALAIYLGPNVYETYHLMNKEASVTVPDADHAFSQKVFVDFKKKDLELLQEIKSQQSDLEELRYLREFQQSYEAEHAKP